MDVKTLKVNGDYFQFLRNAIGGYSNLNTNIGRVRIERENGRKFWIASHTTLINGASFVSAPGRIMQEAVDDLAAQVNAYVDRQRNKFV